MKTQLFKVVSIILILVFTSCKNTKNESTNNATYKDVKVVGAMKDAMWKGELHSKIDLDTIEDKKGLYGLGPIFNLTGEIMIFDGKTYISKVTSDTTMVVKETVETGAPFFVYANVNEWEKIEIPNTIENMTSLEDFITKNSQNIKKPFAFKISGKIEEAVIHVQNLPPNSVVSSPQEAHVGQTNYKLINEDVAILGFYSTEHKTIFTHHDTNMHLHLMTKNKNKMGHLDSVILKNNLLFLPKK